MHVSAGSAWDHTFNTTTGQPLVVVYTGGTARVIQSGAIRVQHNLDKYVALAIFSNVAYAGTSCIPESGNIFTTFAGSRAGTETLTFTGGGNARLTDTDGLNATFKLSRCF
ncbi:MAG: hypothetical protein HY075_07065 [Deltaproteobacteria bacterium]|nr:hypothetical protein [Deltaproteobacteria bacterium]